MFQVGHRIPRWRVPEENCDGNPAMTLACDAVVECRSLRAYLFLMMYRRCRSSSTRPKVTGGFAHPSHGSGPSRLFADA
jgi:hypothetical protein